MSRRLARWSIRHPGLVLLIAAIATLLAGSGLGRLELRTDGKALAPPAAGFTRADAGIRERFAIRDVLAVVVRTESEDGIFNTTSLRRVERLTEALRDLEGVRSVDVVSLATERGFRRDSGVLDFRSLLDPFPESQEQLDRLRHDLRRIEVYEGILVSHDGSSAAILVGVPPEIDRPRFVQDVRRIAIPKEPTDGDSVLVIGAPAAEALLGRHILGDLGVPEALLGEGGESRTRIGMLPFVIAVMGLVFLIAFRTLAAALLPLVEIGISLVLVLGLMGWVGVPVYLTTAVLPVILAAVGIADEIHIFRRYLEICPQGTTGEAEHRAIVTRALDDMAPPVVRTSLTTAVAFTSFALSPLPPVRAFGVFTALGVLICMLLSLTVIPALIVLLGPARLVRESASRAIDGSLAARFAGLAGFASRRRRVIVVATLALLILGFDGVRRVAVQDSWVDGFARRSPFAEATRWFDRQFLGSHRLLIEVEVEPVRIQGRIPAKALSRHDVRLPDPGVDAARLPGAWIRLFQTDGSGGEPREWTTWIESTHVDAGDLVATMPVHGGSAMRWLHPKPNETLGWEIWSEPLLAPATLRRIDAFERFLDQRRGVGGVLGPARYLETVAFMLRPDDAESRQLPADPARARVLWSGYGAVRGGDRLSQLVDRDYTRSLVTLFLEDADYVDTAGLLRAIQDYEDERLGPQGIRLTVGGDVAVSQALIGAVVSTQVRSLLLSLAGILLVASLLSRSLTRGLFCLLPPAFAVFMSFALMGWLGIPLGVATSMFAAMTLGVGVDYAIHLLARFDAAGKNSGRPRLAAALGSAGPAILIDGLAVGLGFGVMILSGVPANARLGLLLITAMSGCFAATVIVLPALLDPSSEARSPEDIP